MMEERFFKFSILSSYPEIVHGISNRAYGDMHFGNLPNEEVAKNREHFFSQLGISASSVVTCQQVHGSKIVTIGKNEKGRGATDPSSAIPEADGLITTEKGIFLMIQTADCLPMLVYDPAIRAVGAIHAGWRGIADQIVLRMIDKFQSLGSDPTNILVCLGPGICQRHFTVKNSVLKIFLNNYPAATFVRNNDGYVDLKKAVLSDLRKAKVSHQNIENSSICTSCENGSYGSFRKEGITAPEAASIIGLR